VLARFRELERADLESLNRWRNDPKVIEHLGANFLFIGPEVDARWYEGYLNGRDRAVRLAILGPGGERPIGCVSLTDIHRINRAAEFSILIGEPDYWSRGIGTAATRAMLAHAFDDLNLHRVYLTVLADNPRAMRVYEKAGFRTEGRQREAVFKCGRYQDLVLMGLLEPEYQEQSRSDSS
jgi:RimJ/RimL family protein N-acetyltransferase